jgi:hypothetical protein
MNTFAFVQISLMMGPHIAVTAKFVDPAKCAVPAKAPEKMIGDTSNQWESHKTSEVTVPGK